MRRALLILGLVLGVSIGGWFGFNLLVPPLKVTALILPPPHAGHPARLANILQADLQPILSGSTAILNVSGRRASELSLFTEATPVTLERGPSGTYWAQLPLTGTQNLGLVVGDNRHDISLPIQADVPPRVAWIGHPSINTSGSIRLPFVAQDDVSLQEISLLVSAGLPEIESTATIPLVQYFPVGQTHAERVHHVDLLAHRLSGQNASLTLTAKDGAGQLVASPPAFIRLPSARLTDRTAQIIASLANELATKPNATNKVAMLLTSVAFTPKDYGHDLTAFLGLRIAYRRLTGLSLLYTPPKYPLPPATSEQVATIRPLLIDIARHVDAGPSRAGWAALQLAFTRAERTIDYGATGAANAAAARQAAFGFLAYTIADYLGGQDPLDTLVPWQLLSQRLLLAIDEAAERNLHDQAYKGMDLLGDLLENALPGNAPIAAQAGLGSLTRMGHELAALGRLSLRLQNAKGPGYTDIRATTQRRITALRKLSAAKEVPGKAVSNLRQTLASLEQADAALAANNKPLAQQSFTTAKHKLAEAAHDSADEMVRRVEGKLIAARIPLLQQKRAPTQVEESAAIAAFATARLDDCTTRRQGHCAPAIRERLERLRHKGK
ncbi:MAG: DUF4175 family protein [Alphaproteobacteria bacterium]